MENKTYSQKVDEWLFAQSGCHLVDFCRKFGYYPTAIKIMSLDESDERKSKSIIAKDIDLKDLYIKCSKDPMSMARKGENRSWTRYFKDLITGWVVEDLVMEMLVEQGIEIVHNGHDAQRKIALGNDVTQESDFRIKVGDVVRNVELTNEFNHLLEQNGFIEKRAPALIKLWESKGIWIYRDLINGKYVLIDFATEEVKLHLRQHNNVMANWAKDVHRYILSENGKKVRDDRMLAAEIISVVGCSIDGKEQKQIIEIEDEDSPPQKFSLGGKLRSPTNKAIVETETKTSKSPIKNTIKSTPQSQNIANPPRHQEVKPLTPPSPSLDEDVLDDDGEDVESYDGIDLGDGDFV